MHSHIKTKQIHIIKCLFINPITCLILIKKYTKQVPCNWLTVSRAAEKEKGRSLQKKYVVTACSIQLKSYIRYLKYHAATLLCVSHYLVCFHCQSQFSSSVSGGGATKVGFDSVSFVSLLGVLIWSFSSVPFLSLQFPLLPPLFLGLNVPSPLCDCFP